MLFPLRQQQALPVGQATGIPLGGQAVFNLTRDFFLDSLMLEVSGTVTTPATTASADGILGLVKNVQLQIADGSSNRTQTNASGLSLIQKGFQLTGAIDQSTLTAMLVGTGNGSFLLRIPLFFKSPKISDPIGSAFLLPLPRYNANPVLQVTFSGQSGVDQAVSPAFAISAGISARLLINKRQVDNVQFPTIDTEFVEQQVTYAASGQQQLFEAQVPGSYLFIGMRGYTGATPAQSWADPTDSGTAPSGNVTLQILGNVLRNSRWSDIQYMNQLAAQDNWNAVATRSNPNGLFTGLAFYNFLHDGFGLEVGELGSVVNTNLLAGAGTRLQILTDIATGGNIVTYFWDRVFGDLSPLQLQFGTSVG
jgi:hypothetical protein